MMDASYHGRSSYDGTISSIMMDGSSQTNNSNVSSMSTSGNGHSHYANHTKGNGYRGSSGMVWFMVLAIMYVLCMNGASYVEAATCPCTLPTAVACPSGCFNCSSTVPTCLCDTICQPASQTACSGAGYGTAVTNAGCTSSSGKSWSYYTCQKTGSSAIGTGICSTCKPNYYGSTCVACPGGNNPCNKNVTAGYCLDGINGAGTCQCNTGWAGPICQYSNVGTCNGHGTAQQDGSCVCATGFSGTSCNQCATDYWSYPNCTYCNNQATCLGLGTCNSAGKCDCNSPVTGPNCNDCFPNYYNPPTCKFCDAATTCNGHGTCDSSGGCACFSTHTGASCNVCADEVNNYGPSCTQCPGLALYGQRCGGHGTCASGYANTGICTCDSGYFGTDCISPTIQSMTPRNGPTEGNTPVHIEGINFLAGTSVYAYNNERPDLGLQAWGLISASSTAIDTASEPMAVGSGNQGNRTVVVRLASQALSLYNVFFLYDPPLITSFDPPQGLAGQRVTIRGRSFGNNGTISFDGTVIETYSRQGTAFITEVYFTAPVNIGANHQVTVSWGRGSNTTLWSYQPPIISAAGPAVTTMGTDLTPITVTGVGFGYTALPQPVTTIGGVTCTYQSHNNTRIVCLPGAGRGTGVTVAVTAGGVIGAGGLMGSADVYSFRAPWIRGVSGCNNVGNRTIGCATNPAGTVTITIDGFNFGAVYDSQVSVYIGDNECTNVAMPTAHYRLTCTLPAGFGQNISVQVTVAGLTGSAKYLDYASPIITQGTLLLVSTGAVNLTDSGIAHIVCADNNGTQRVQFQGQYFGSDIDAVVITYGSLENPAVFTCTPNYVTETLVECTTSPGVGGNLHFQIKVAGVKSNTVSDFYSYPPPSITPNTLRFTTGIPSTSIIGNTTQGEEILFNGQYFGAQASGLITVTYIAKVNSTTPYTCKLLTSVDPANQIDCKTVPGDGLEMVFTVCVGPGTSALCVTGTDTYSYPVPPQVTSVTGCPVNDLTLGRTTNCPTDGLVNGDIVRLTIQGLYFGLSGAAVLVGDSTCTQVVHTVGRETFEVQCTLPAGVGYSKSVVVSQQLRFSRGVDSLDYAPPTLAQVSGCTDNGVNTANCPRLGGSLVTITGTNFGVGPAKILVGGVSCDNVTHDATNPHILATCNLAAGNGVDRPVLLIQNLGEYSDTTTNQIYVSYTQCTPGYYSVGTDVGCHACSVGTYTALDSSAGCVTCSFGTYLNQTAGTACLQCDPGYYNSLTEQTGCVVCEPGKYYSSSGATICSVCTTGRYAANNGTSQCSACGIGRYQNLQGNTTCIDCAPGSYLAAEGLDECLLCEPGYYNPDSGKGSCTPCPVGQKSATGNLAGSTSCVVCGLGEKNDQTGKSACTPCLAGTYGNVNGSTECTPCPIGTFTATSGLTVCDVCTPGYYNDKEGAQACTACPLGTISRAYQVTTCSACDYGKYQGSTGQSVCVNCGNGTISTELGQAYCIGCFAGTYTDSEGQFQCISCPKGRYSVNGANIGSTGCMDCGPGTYASNPGYTGCAECAPGQYSTEYGAVACELCPTGKYQEDSGQQGCLSCSPGKITASLSSLSCDACAAGKYNDAYNASVCSDCGTGKYQPTEGQDACLLCAPGYQAPYTASQSCISCTSGQYTQNVGASICQNCAIGNYSDTKSQLYGITDCLMCPVGRYSNRDSSSDCIACDAGSFNNMTGASDCQPCPIGTWQDTPGMSECYLCSNGTFNRDVSQRACTPCAYGYYQPEEGQTFCLTCDPGAAQGFVGQPQCDSCIAGTYTTTSASTSCVQCAKGKYAWDTGRVIDCQPCLNGTYQALTGQVGCDSCPLGRYNPVDTGVEVCTACPPGNFLNTTGGTVCTKCSEGRFQNREGQTACDQCPYGKYVDTPGASDCTICAKGYYSDELGLRACKGCPAGTYQDLETQQTCKPNPIGYFSTPRAQAPSKCPSGQVAPYTGMAACLTCEERATSNDASTTCICQAGLYLTVYNASTDNNEMTCDTCPKGAQCTSPGVTFSNMQMVQGYWRANNESLIIYACMLPTLCLGGSTGTCAQYRTGTLCSLCIEGYRSSTPTSECSKCPSRSAAFGVAVVIVIAVIIALVVMYWIVLKSDSHLLQAAIDADNSALAMQLDEDEIDEDTLIDAANGAPVMVMETRAKPNFTFKLKIIVGFMQIATNLSFIVSVPWPSYYSSFISNFQFFNLDFIPWQSVGCASGFDFYTKFLVLTVTPIVILACIFLFYLLPMYWFDRRDMVDQSMYRAARKRSRRRFWKLILFTVFLMYPIVSRNVMAMFVCKNINGEDYLTADFDLRCFTSTWYKYVGAASFMVVVYPVGVPAFFGFMLWRYRARLQEPGVRMQLGFLYEAYNSTAMWFEMADMLHKLTLTSLLFFVNEELQMPFGMLVATIYTITILYFRPYVRKGDDRLHLFVQIELFLVIQAGYILYDTAGTTLDYNTDVLLSAVLIAVTIALVLIFILMAGKNIRKMLRQREREKEEEAMLENALEMTPEDRAAMHRKELATQEEWEEYKTADEVLQEKRDKENSELNEFEIIRKMLTKCCKCCTTPGTNAQRRWRKVLLHVVYTFKCCMRGCETEAMTARRHAAEEKEAKRLREEGTPVLKVDSTGRPMWVKQRASAGGSSRGNSRLLDINAELKKNPSGRLTGSGGSGSRSLGFSVDRRSTSLDAERRSTGTPKGSKLRDSLRSSNGGFRNSKERTSRDRSSKDGPKGSLTLSPLFPDFDDDDEVPIDGEGDPDDSDNEKEGKERAPKPKEEVGISMAEKLRREAREKRAAAQKKRYADDEPDPPATTEAPKSEPKSPKAKKTPQSRESLVRELSGDEVLAEHEIGNMRARKDLERQRRVSDDEKDPSSPSHRTTAATGTAEKQPEKPKKERMTRDQFFAKEFGFWETHPGEEARAKKAAEEAAAKKAAEDAKKPKESEREAEAAEAAAAAKEAAEIAAREAAIAHERGQLTQEFSDLRAAPVLQPLQPVIVTPPEPVPSQSPSKDSLAAGHKRRESFEHVVVTEVDPNAPAVAALPVTAATTAAIATPWSLPPPPQTGRQASRGSSRAGSRVGSRANSRRSSPERQRTPLSAEASAERNAMMAEFAGMRQQAPLTVLRPPSPQVVSFAPVPSITTGGALVGAPTGTGRGSAPSTPNPPAPGTRSRRTSFDNTVVLSEDHHSSDEDEKTKRTPTKSGRSTPTLLGGLIGRLSRGPSRPPSPLRQPLLNSSDPEPLAIGRPRVLSADEADEQDAMMNEFASLRAAAVSPTAFSSYAPPSVPEHKQQQRKSISAPAAATRRDDDHSNNDDDDVLVQEVGDDYEPPSSALPITRPATPTIPAAAPSAAVVAPKPVAVAAMTDEERAEHEAMLREMDELRGVRR